LSHPQSTDKPIYALFHSYTRDLLKSCHRNSDHVIIISFISLCAQKS